MDLWGLRRDHLKTKTKKIRNGILLEIFAISEFQRVYLRGSRAVRALGNLIDVPLEPGQLSVTRTSHFRTLLI